MTVKGKAAPGIIKASKTVNVSAFLAREAAAMATKATVKPASRPTGEALGSARFEFADDLAITARLSRDGSGLWLRLAATGGAAAQRLDARWQGWAYQVGDWKEKAMLPRLGELEAKPAAPPAGAPPAR
jgi:hypothetical protein